MSHSRHEPPPADGAANVVDPADLRDLDARADAALELLESIAAEPGILDQLAPEDRGRLVTAAGRIARPDSRSRRRLNRVTRLAKRRETRALDDAILDDTGIRQKRREAVFATPLPPGPSALSPGDSSPEDTPEDTPETAPEAGSRRSSGRRGALRQPRKCYVCKAEFRTLHFFYDAMCPPCAEFNWRKRNQSADLSGRVALVTGARVKIGYQAAIMLLRAGARVVVTTRFPRDAAARYAREDDFAAWRDRLHIYGLDLRHTPSVELVADRLTERLDRLDFILSNACQTVRRPPGFYAHLMAPETGPASALPPAHQRLLADYEDLRRDAPQDPHAAMLPPGRPGVPQASQRPGVTLASQRAGVDHAATLSQLALLHDDLRHSDELFPENRYDADRQQIDRRPVNSWRLGLADVPAVELLEVHLVNAIAPFVLNARLKPLMAADRTFDKHIVNVSAMEGQFYRSFKTDRHPHTNMAKAALNMMTRTSASDYIKDGIHMNSVDTGWVTDEDPEWLAARKLAEHRFHPPLDIVDGAARICDPIFSGFQSGHHSWGKFLKDYRPVAW